MCGCVCVRAVLPPPQTGTPCHLVPGRSARCPGWSSGMLGTGSHLQSVNASRRFNEIPNNPPYKFSSCVCVCRCVCACALTLLASQQPLDALDQFVSVPIGVDADLFQLLVTHVCQHVQRNLPGNNPPKKLLSVWIMTSYHHHVQQLFQPHQTSLLVSVFVFMKCLIKLY